MMSEDTDGQGPARFGSAKMNGPGAFWNGFSTPERMRGQEVGGGSSRDAINNKPGNVYAALRGVEWILGVFGAGDNGEVTVGNGAERERERDEGGDRRMVYPRASESVP